MHVQQLMKGPQLSATSLIPSQAEQARMQSHATALAAPGLAVCLQQPGRGVTLGWCLQTVTENQGIIMEFVGSNYLLSISQVMVKDKTGTLASGLRGRLVPATAFVFNAASGSGITVGGQRNIAAPKLFKVEPCSSLRP